MMGTNTQMVVKVEAVIAPATCTAPETAACTRLYPMERRR